MTKCIKILRCNFFSQQVAARNNMAVWRDKCLHGSLRVARPGELARKISDIVTDDQDTELEQVVHTHLCILLAEGQDLDLKPPVKMFASATPPKKTLRRTKSVESMDLGKAAPDQHGSARTPGRASVAGAPSHFSPEENLMLEV